MMVIRDEAYRRRVRRERIVSAIVIAIAAAAVFWFQRWNAIEEAKLARENTYVPLKETITPEILKLQEYVRIDTTNPPGNEIEGARWLGAQLAKSGIAFEIIEAAPGRASLYARITGRRPGEGLLLLNHIDVMPANPSQWTLPPFSGGIRLNMMWSRGTLDMKGLALCELEGFIALARSGKVPERDVVFLAVADEESGGKLGTTWLLEHRPDVFAGIRYAINEGGITETFQDKLTYFGIEVGSKQLVTVKLHGPSREVLRQARFALEPYLSTHEPSRVLPEVRRYLRDIAPHRVQFRDLMADIDRTIAIGKFWRLNDGYRTLAQDIVAAEGPVRDGKAWSMKVYLANLPDAVPEQRIDWLRSVVAPYGLTLEVLVKNGPVPMTSPDTPFFGLLEREIHKVYGPVAVGTVVLVGSSTDSRYLRTRGILCYGIWPFPVTVSQTAGIHGIDERIRLDWFQHGVELTRNLVAAYAFGQ
ncbi:MAG: putative peptidase family [Acidobacteria bacterium]|nr:putative peptidase family [Acidobacteriota bacterium]